MNHSQRFWRLVDKLHPGLERAKAWLDAHGTDLHRYGEPDSGYSGAPISEPLRKWAMLSSRCAATTERAGSAFTRLA